MALGEAGVRPERWSIDAIDLSVRAIGRALRGCYGELSFRSMPPGLREKHFRPCGREWEIDASLLDTVRYRVGNVVEPGFLAGEAAFDLIFCRNLFLYLGTTGRERALGNLRRLLADDGLVCAGPTEPFQFARASLRATGPAGYFLYTTGTPAPPAPLPVGQASSLARGVVGQARTLALREDGDKKPPPPEHPLIQVQRLADQGRLREALDQARRHLSAHGPSAGVYYLLGVVHEALREGDEAIRCLERALYLEPDHRDALMLLMLLRKQRGEEERSALLRQRLERIRPRGDQ
jgi:chemotaxis protein methyltransferase WspC